MSYVFYPFKEKKKALEPWWQSVTDNLTNCPLASVRLFKQRLKGELLRAAHYLEIKPLEKYFAFKIAQELHDKKVKEINEQILTKAGFGSLVKSSFKLVKRYFSLITTHAEEYTIADYILAKGQPKKIDKDTSLSILNAGLTSLYGMSCIDGLKKIISLDFADNNLIEIVGDELRYLPNLESLDFSRNSISSIKLGSFVGLTKLLDLNLSGTKLITLNSTMFQGLVELRKLRIDSSQINSIEPGAFKELKNLTFLELDYNNLTVLEPNTFQGLTNLKSLKLSYNKIMTINNNAFKGLNSLSFLYLSGNVLTNLQNKVFDGLVNLKELYLARNQLISLEDETFAAFQDLERLSLVDNKLNMLPASLFDLKKCIIFVYENPLSIRTLAKIVYFKNRYNMDVTFSRNA